MDGVPRTGGTMNSEAMNDGGKSGPRSSGAASIDGPRRAAGERIGVAVVGAGYWGPNLVRNIQGCDDLQLRWLCDLDADRTRRVVGRYSTVGTTTSLDEVLDDDNVAAIAVATPAGTHAEIALRALDAGKHVLVEKPLASSYADGLKLVEAAEDRQLILMCDHTYCYTPSVQRIRELVADGELGTIQYIDSVRINLGLVQPDVNVVWDLAPHDLSILDFVLPDDVAVEAVAAHGADPIGAGRACIAYLTLQLTGGAIAHAHVNWLSPTKIRTTIVGGSRRTVVWDDLSPTQRLAVYDRGVDLSDPAAVAGLSEETKRNTLIAYRSGDMVAPALAETEALKSVMTEWASAMRTGVPPRTDGRAGLRVLDILEAASRSLEYSGAVVPLRQGSRRRAVRP
jgi:predicted dehydrogenase